MMMNWMRVLVNQISQGWRCPNRTSGGEPAAAAVAATTGHDLAALEVQRYQQILEDQTELICRYLTDTTIVYVNSAYCRYFGLKQADLIGKSYQPVIHEADRDVVSRLVQSMNCQHPQTTIENRVVVNGEVRWTRWNNRCFCDENGQVTAYQSVGQDITRFKAIEQDLRDSEQRYRCLIETIPQLVWVAEADGLTVLDFNQRWFDYTGQTYATAQGTGWLAAIHPDDIDPVHQHWQAAVADRTPFEAEYRLRRADGVYLWHLAKAEPALNQQGQATRWYGTCTDISDRKRIEAEQQRVEAALQQLNETLESRVTDRTRELVATNAALKTENEERQRAEAQLRESEARFRRAVVNAPFPIFIHSETGAMLQVSQAVEEISGYSVERLQTVSDWVRLAYGDRQTQTQMADQIDRLYRSDRRVEEGEFAIKTQQGTQRTWLFSSAPLGRLSDGTRLVISMAADVTAQKQAEAALATRLRQQAVVAQLSQIALSGLDLATLFDETTRLVASSLAVDYCKVLELLPDGQQLWLRAGVGWQPGIVGQATVSNDRDSQAGYTLLSQHPVVVTDLLTETRFQGPALLTDHGVVSGVSLIIPGSGDRPFGILGVHSTQPRQFTQDDVTFLQSVVNLLAAAISRKLTESELYQLNLTLEQRVKERTQALESVNQELEAFSYSVAHDVRAPLRAIQGFARVLEEDYSQTLDDLGLEYIHRMANAAEHLDVLVTDLLSYSRLGRTAIKLKRVGVASVIKSLLTDLDPLLSAKKAEVIVAPNLPYISAQRSLLKQALGNLIDNALKFVAPDVQPRIQIWATSGAVDDASDPDSSPWVRIWVEDNGIGIAPQYQSRIFQTFERLHGIEAYPGTGIGLAIVKRSVERMGGRVGVESSLYQGSRFWIELQPWL